LNGVQLMSERYAVVGGAGFIGSHFTSELLKLGNPVLIIDNFCSGTEKHVLAFKDNPKFQLVRANVEDTKILESSLQGIDTVIHLASNPDIAKAAIEPRIDFEQGTVLTESVVEAARRSKVKTILYASGSGVYGDAGTTVLTEKSPLNPISTYGASKLASEALLSSYSFMFGIKTISFRFANVVGDMQTHGVGYDFLRKLQKNKKELRILGNGTQSKSYVHVNDVVSGVLLAHRQSNSLNDVFNISTDDFLSVNEIANLAAEVSGLNPRSVEFKHEGGDRGWKADVPIVRLSAAKLNSLGWSAQYSSLTAMKFALSEMFNEINE
jgi:UDP-glucose 4-epimerase